jgi:hypothetical protein
MTQIRPISQCTTFIIGRYHRDAQAWFTDPFLGEPSDLRCRTEQVRAERFAGAVIRAVIWNEWERAVK